MWHYLREEVGLKVANATDERFTQAAELLKTHPQAGSLYGSVNRRRLALARLPFIIVYATAPGAIYILRVLHTSQRRKYE